MELKLIFGLILIFNGALSQDYCNKSLCKGSNHIACGHSGVSRDAFVGEINFHFRISHASSSHPPARTIAISLGSHVIRSS